MEGKEQSFVLKPDLELLYKHRLKVDKILIPRAKSLAREINGKNKPGY